MVWQRNIASLEIYDATTNAVATILPHLPGTNSAPAWSPIDNRLLFSVSGDGGANLIIQDGDAVQTLVAGLHGLVSYSWSPDGRYVAYRVAAQGSVSELAIYDVDAGEIVARSPNRGVISFFWSPDSRKVAYITLAVQPGSQSTSAGELAAPAPQNTPMEIAWSVLDVETGTSQYFDSFRPTAEMIYLLSFFDQFAQSHRVWSPDSRYLVYSEIQPDGTVVDILDTFSADARPTVVADGVIGIWSFE